MKHLVLGSAGQIGAHLTSYLRSIDQEVVEFDIANGWEQDLRLSSHPYLINAIRDADFVYFLAFDVGGYKYLQSAGRSYQFIQNNISIMQNVFNALEYYRKPFLFASSQMAAWSDSPYAVLKLVGEQYTKNLNGLIVRLWNIYGIEHNPAKFHVLTDLINMAKQGEIRLISDGTEVRQFLHGNDCAKGLYQLASRWAEFGSYAHLHLTSFEWTSILDLADLVSREFGFAPIYTTPIDARTPKYEPDRFILNHWRPEISLLDGVRHVIQNS